ncbi:LacI family DNA-binding transcriptional regulator [Zhihengliuella flava]|uniref:DNA-binding LacI/PurR family transcriptional regulator n=1 Tax=Zhihengliuella flava TaxID=1285193 RepID=A0A931D642_9MICC|nr:LacI family DNA-binding transcriptional regulator [Zhihengliuella flava]MBG6084400.1 DNA-binding LacI/PurR family transcriptional regulator [Zhihengliuella flava]
MATMQDVAQHAGVSIATVSFVLNGTKAVSEPTKRRVESAMAELGYRRNPAGSALARGRTDIIALLYPALQRQLHATATRFFTSAAERAQERGFSLVMWPAANEAQEIDALTKSGLIDGVLLMEVQLEDERVEALRRGTTPFALIGRTQDPTGLPFVDIDFEQTVISGLEELVARGHTSIAFIYDHSGPTTLHAYGAIARASRTFRDTIAQSGLSGVTVDCRENPRAGREVGETFRERYPDVTAVLIMNELASPGFMTGLRQAGTQVPEDLAVLSLVSSDTVASMSDPELAFMRAPAEELGRLGTDAVIDRITAPDSPLPNTLVPCEMVNGNSLPRLTEQA